MAGAAGRERRAIQARLTGNHRAGGIQGSFRRYVRKFNEETMGVGRSGFPFLRDGRSTRRRYIILLHCCNCWSTAFTITHSLLLSLSVEFCYFQMGGAERECERARWSELKKRVIVEEYWSAWFYDGRFRFILLNNGDLFVSLKSKGLGWLLVCIFWTWSNSLNKFSYLIITFSISKLIIIVLIV